MWEDGEPLGKEKAVKQARFLFCGFLFSSAVGHYDGRGGKRPERTIKMIFLY